LVFITVSFSDNQAIIIENRENLWRVVHILIKIVTEYNWTLSTKETKVIVFKEKHPVR
jgi:hypothetical protein